MIIKEVRENALKKYRSHKLNSWIISIICGLLIAAILMLGTLSSTILLIAVPFLVIPLFFSCVFLHLGLSEKDEVSAKNLFGFFGLYFRAPFNSTFSVIKSFLKSFVIEILVGFISTGICYLIFTRSETFVVTINEIIDSISEGTYTTESLQAALDANGGELGRFIDITNSISLLTFAYSFIFFILREEITVYMRLITRDNPFSPRISQTFVKANYKSFNKAYFALNWPLLVILLLGMVLGAFFSIFVLNNYSLCGVVGLITGISLSIFYLPFYFCNMEAINEELSIEMSLLSEEQIQEIFERYGVNFVTSKPEEEVDGTKKDSDDTESS